MQRYTTTPLGSKITYKAKGGSDLIFSTMDNNFKEAGYFYANFTLPDDFPGKAFYDKLGLCTFGIMMGEASKGEK